jgi:Na+-transporting methylmalonyl-CoA/oxaloacetate decarboxylase gamma subunit
MVDPLQIIAISLTVVFVCLIILGIAVTLVSKAAMKLEKQPPSKEEKT